MFGVGFLLILGVALLVRQTDFDVDIPFVGGGAGDPAANALRQDAPPPFTAAVSDVRGALAIAEELPSADPVLTVAVEVPDGATEMQLDDTPTFAGAAWQPVAAQADVPVGGIGYRDVFVRFRLGDGSVSQTSVVGGEIDPTWAAATASETGLHEASWVRPFSATEFVVRVEAGRVEAGTLEAYDLDNPAAGDDIDSRRGLPVVTRNGETYGLGVSARRDVIRRPDRLVGRPLDVDALLDDAWTITSTDDPDYTDGQTPVSVRHVARPSDGGFDGDMDRLWALVHDLVIEVPQPLQPGSSYTISPPTMAPIVFDYEPATNLSPAVRVNQVGFAPSDQAKVAYLSGWFDGIGSSATGTASNPSFAVVDTSTGEPAITGTGSPRPGGDELGLGDLTGAPVIELDFSSLDRLGRYQVCVDDIGCSHPFDIDPDVWSDLTATVARSLHHQRSGIELGPPYTSFARPRPYHPEDGVVVRASGYSLLEAQTDTENTDFDRLAELRTDQVVPEAWGGHFDAGDWDRRIQHLFMARNVAQLVMLYPERFEDFELNVPESGDAVPDLLDEALWTVELFQRMQTPEGAIRGGIEATEHPPANTASWVDDLAVLAYEPDPFSSYVYAGVAAEVAVALRPYDQGRASDLLASARRAMDWADQQTPFVGTAERVAEQRTVAAAALLLATGERGWHDRFLESADFVSGGDTNLSCHAHTSCDAAWLYLQADQSVTDPAIRQELENRFLVSADALVEVGDQTAYGWALESPTIPLIWGLGVGGSPKVSGLLRAHVLSGDEGYRAAAVRAASVTLGSNPLGQVMLTGVGQEPVRHPQINDVKYGGLPAWPGTPIYGFHQLNSIADEQWVVDDILAPAGVSPAPTDLPYLWQWYDVDSVAQYNEFTVHQSHGEALLAFALLAATV